MTKAVIILLVFVATLSGCETTVPVERKFPDAPAKLLEPAPELKPLPPDTKELSALIDNANENYHSFRVLREHFEAWQLWYKEQKANFDSVK